VVEVRLKGADKEKVKCAFNETGVTLTLAGDTLLALALIHPVLPKECAVKVLASKIELRLKKREGGHRWAALEGEGKEPELTGAPSAAASAYANIKDWDSIAKEATAGDDKLEGEQALNQMFQQIYANGNDDLRRAMNKSFTESGGTVLSTNWEEIKKMTVECKPPEGMEFKRWT